MSPQARKQRRAPEKRAQGAIVKALRSLGFFVSTFSQAQRAQMTAGIPDLYATHRRFGGYWIEVKAPSRRNHARGGCSVDQLQWHAAARECGETVLVAYCVDDVLNAIPELRRVLTSTARIA